MKTLATILLLSSFAIACGSPVDSEDTYTGDAYEVEVEDAAEECDGTRFTCNELLVEVTIGDDPIEAQKTN